MGNKALRIFVHGVISDTAENCSSMLQDIKAGRRTTEVRYFNGYVSLVGREKYRVDVPMNTDLCERVEKLTETF